MNKKYYESVDILKVLLLMCIIISTYTMINTTGVPVLPMLSFAVGTYYLLVGYFVLRDGEDLSERIKRSIRHTAIAFAIAAVVYFALLCLAFLITGAPVSSLFTPKSVFDFFVLNIWEPSLGGNIWIIQAMLYALVIFYFLEKWKLLRYDLYIMIALFVITILFGECADIIHFHVRSYTYISGNFLTRAMPYMLLGRIVYRARFRKDFGRMKNWMWVLIFIVGFALSFIETFGLARSHHLVYLNHMIGFIPMSVAAAMFFLNMKREFSFGKYCADVGKAGYYSYSVIAQMIYLLIGYAFPGSFLKLLPYLGLFTLIVTMLLSVLYAWLRNRKLVQPKEGELTDEAEV